jgi:hypothetical protein
MKDELKQMKKDIVRLEKIIKNYKGALKFAKEAYKNEKNKIKKVIK